MPSQVSVYLSTYLSVYIVINLSIEINTQGRLQHRTWGGSCDGVMWAGGGGGQPVIQP